jgi:hypothetical protein
VTLMSCPSVKGQRRHNQKQQVFVPTLCVSCSALYFNTAAMNFLAFAYQVTVFGDLWVHAMALETNFFNQYAPSSTCSHTSSNACLFCKSSRTIPQHLGNYIRVLN